MEPVSRRSVLSGACALFALSGIGALPAAANDAVKKIANGRLSVQLKKVPELSKVGGSVNIGYVKGSPVAVTRTGASSYVAFSLSCPHQGAIVEREGSGWICEAHGSQFKLNGDLVMGPATTRLARIPIKVSRGIATIG